jgi:hypothetical protein
MNKPPFCKDFLAFLRYRSTRYEILETRPLVVDVLPDGRITNRRFLKPGMVLDSRRRVIDYIARTRTTRTIAAGKVEVVVTNLDLSGYCETRTFYTRTWRIWLDYIFSVIKRQNPKEVRTRF